MATRSRAPKPAGKRVLSSAVQGERAGPAVGWGGPGAAEGLKHCCSAWRWPLGVSLPCWCLSLRRLTTTGPFLSPYRQVRGQQEAHAQGAYHCVAPASKPAC